MTDRYLSVRVTDVHLDGTEELAGVTLSVGSLAVFNKVVEHAPEAIVASHGPYPRTVRLDAGDMRTLVSWSGGVKHPDPDRPVAGMIYDALFWVFNVLED